MNTGLFLEILFQKPSSNIGSSPRLAVRHRNKFSFLRDRMKKPVDCDTVIPKRIAMIFNASTEDKLFLFVFLDTNEVLFFTLLSMT